MKFDLEDYIEGRLQLGGCVMWILGIVIAIAWVIWMFKDIIESIKNFDETWPIWIFVVLPILVVCGILIYFKYKD